MFHSLEISYHVKQWMVIYHMTGSDICLLSVMYVDRCRQHRWRCAEVTFTCSDEALCQRWVSSIRDQLSTISKTLHQHLLSNAHKCCQKLSMMWLLFALTASRPKHLLVYINPYGGKRQGKRIYEQKVAPLFAQAGISTHAIGKAFITYICSSASCARDLHLKPTVPVCTVCCHSDGVCKPCQGSPQDAGRAQEVWWVRFFFSIPDRSSFTKQMQIKYIIL